MNVILTTAAMTAHSTAVNADFLNPDAELIAACERLRELRPAYNEASAEFDAKFSELTARKPQKPKELRWHPADGLNVRHYGKECWYDPLALSAKRNVPQVSWELIGPDDLSMPTSEIWDSVNVRPREGYEHLFWCRPDPRRQARLEQALAALDSYTAEVDAIKEEIGFHEVEDRVNALYRDHLGPIEDKLAQTEPKTLAGVRAKAQVLVDLGVMDNDDDEIDWLDQMIVSVVTGAARLAA